MVLDVECLIAWAVYLDSACYCRVLVFPPRNNNVLQLKMFPIHCCYWSEFRPADSVWRKGSQDIQSKTTSGYLPQPARQQTEYFMASYSCLSGIVWFFGTRPVSPEEKGSESISSPWLWNTGTHTIPCPVLFPPCQPMTAVQINLQNPFLVFFLLYHLCSQRHY